MIKFLEEVSEQHPEIQKWSLRLTFHLSDNCVDNLKQIVVITAEKLKLLSFDINEEVTDSMLVELVNAAGGLLTHLILNFKHISGVGGELSVESEKLKKLQSSDLLNCYSLNDAGAAADNGPHKQ